MTNIHVGNETRNCSTLEEIRQAMAEAKAIAMQGKAVNSLNSLNPGTPGTPGTMNMVMGEAMTDSLKAAWAELNQPVPQPERQMAEGIAEENAIRDQTAVPAKPRVVLDGVKTMDEATAIMLKDAKDAGKGLRKNQAEIKVHDLVWDTKHDAFHRKYTQVWYQGASFRWIMRVSEPNTDIYPDQKGCLWVLIYNVALEGQPRLAEKKQVRKDFSLSKKGEYAEVIRKGFAQAA